MYVLEMRIGFFIGYENNRLVDIGTSDDKLTLTDPTLDRTK